MHYPIDFSDSHVEPIWLGALVGSPANYSVPLPTNCLVCPAPPGRNTALCWSCPAYSRPIPTYSQSGTWILRHLGTFTSSYGWFLHDFRVSREHARLIPTSAPMSRGPYGTPSGYSAVLPAICHVLWLITWSLWTIGWVRRHKSRLSPALCRILRHQIGIAVGSSGILPTSSIHLPFPSGMVRWTTDDGWWSAKPSHQSLVCSV